MSLFGARGQSGWFRWRAFFYGRAEGASLKPWNTLGEQTKAAPLAARTIHGGKASRRRSELGKGL